MLELQKKLHELSSKFKRVDLNLNQNIFFYDLADKTLCSTVTTVDYVMFVANATSVTSGHSKCIFF